MPRFATYWHPQTCYTSRPSEKIRFVGHSFPYFSQVRRELETALTSYPALPIRKADYQDYRQVHTKKYLDKLALMASGELVAELPRLSAECTGLEFCLPGYLYSLGGMLEAIDQMKSGMLERAYCFSLGITPTQTGDTDIAYLIPQPPQSDMPKIWDLTKCSS